WRGNGGMCPIRANNGFYYRTFSWWLEIGKVVTSTGAESPGINVAKVLIILIAYVSVMSNFLEKYFSSYL
ncbi:hypothetical protein, partial [Corynebacterium matruchotii]